MGIHLNKSFVQVAKTHPEFINWNEFRSQDIILSLPINFIEVFAEEIDSFDIISIRTDLSLKFIHKYRNKLDWSELDYSNFTEKFIREHIKYVDWDNVCWCDNIISEKFINDFHDKFSDWEGISCNNLPINIIRKFKDKIIWERLVEFVELDDNFIKEFYLYINGEEFLANKDFSDEYKKLYQELIKEGE